MIPITAIPAPANLLAQLVNPAVRSLVLAGGAALTLWLFRVKTTSWRLFAWTAVLYAALAMPLLSWILPPLFVPAPAFLRTESRPGDAGGSQVFSGAPTSSISQEAPVPADGATVELGKRTRQSEPAYGTSPNSVAASATSRRLSIPWAELAGVYLVVALLLLTRFALGLVLGRRLVLASQRIEDHRIRLRIASRASLCGLKLLPRVAESELIAVPVTMGALRPTILLPAGWQEWDEAKLDAVIAHEVSHVARNDALTQRLSLVHRALFWFSPLAWWLDRHLAELAEEASDEAALSCGADRTAYARALLAFFEALHAGAGRVRWQGVAMARAGQAEQRLERILGWKGTVPMNLKRSLAIAVLVLGIPIVFLAASVRPANWPQEPAPPAPPTAPVEGVAGVAPVSGVASVGPVGGVPTVAPVAPVAPMTPPSNPLWRSQSSRADDRRGFFYGYGYDEDERFVIASGKSDSYTMSGSTQDVRHVEKLRKQIPGDFIWFQRDEKSYIIRDQATIDRAKKLWAPQEELGKKQEELGKQQEALGKQQEELAAKMEQVRVNVPDMTAELDRVKAKLQKLGSSATMEEVGDLQSELGELQSKIGEIQGQAGEQQGKLGEQQGELGEKQGKLGEMQGQLGQQQAELAEKASRQMKGILDEAIKNGTAKPEEEIVKSPTL